MLPGLSGSGEALLQPTSRVSSKRLPPNMTRKAAGWPQARRHRATARPGRRRSTPAKRTSRGCTTTCLADAPS